tara:strand:- start:60585 stop:61196 length:612 start_codon:yes stop_codon:yes gene_type:complete
MRDEGVIKFKCTLKKTGALDESLFLNIEKWRTILYKISLIGEYKKEGLGYGNLSRRVAQDEFVITGTQTGKYPNLTGHQYTRVVKCNLATMKVEATGPTNPSSESLTHYAIYSQCPQIQFVFHVHHKGLWEFMLNNGYDQTADNIDYGTQEMANEAIRCIGNKKFGIFAMKGHEDGVISYAQTSEDAGKILLETLKQSKSQGA